MIPPGTKINSKGKEVPHGTRLYSIASTRYGDSFDGKTVSRGPGGGGGEVRLVGLVGLTLLGALAAGAGATTAAAAAGVGRAGCMGEQCW